MRVVFSILLCLISTLFLTAQKELKFTSFLGKVVKHKSELLYESPPYSLGLEFSYASRTSGKKTWHQRWNRPSTEVSVVHFYLGNNEVLGSLTGVIPTIGFYFREREKTSLRFHLGIGAAHVTRRFDEISNPTNNAIGSNLNSVINFKFSHQWRISNEMELFAGLNFTHFSNGKTSSPNSGINILALFLGTSLKVGKIKDDPIDYDPEKKNFRKWGINSYVGYGVKENDVPGGPRYPVKILSLGGHFSTDEFNRIVFGWEYEYHDEEYAFAISTFLEEDQAQKEAKKQILYIGDELLFGRIAIRFQVGYYLVNTRAEAINTKLFVKYRIPIPKTSSMLYTGFMMKTHFAKANYLSIVAGYEF